MKQFTDEFMTLLRQHVRADDLEGVDDAVLRQYASAAMDYVVRATQRPFRELQSGCCTGDLPDELVQAVLLLAGHWYNMREAVAPGTVTSIPYGVSALILPFRRFSR